MQDLDFLVHSVSQGLCIVPGSWKGLEIIAERREKTGKEGKGRREKRREKEN